MNTDHVLILAAMLTVFLMIAIVLIPQVHYYIWRHMTSDASDPLEELVRQKYLGGMTIWCYGVSYQTPLVDEDGYVTFSQDPRDSRNAIIFFDAEKSPDLAHIFSKAVMRPWYPNFFSKRKKNYIRINNRFYEVPGFISNSKGVYIKVRRQFDLQLEGELA